MRREHADLMNEVRCEVQYICNKYNVQISLLYFNRNKYIPTPETQLPDVLNEVLNHDL